METKIYPINGINHYLKLTVAQDEALAPIMSELYDECGDTLTCSSNELATILNEKENQEKRQAASLNLSIDFLKLMSWIYKKKYARRVMAILLVPVGQEYADEDVPAREAEFAKQEVSDIAKEVIQYFFTKTGVFGRSMPTSSMTA
jgi:hypothetical protein